MGVAAVIVVMMFCILGSDCMSYRRQRKTTVKKRGTDDIEAQADAADNQDDLGIRDGLKLDEALDGLYGDAQTKSEEKGAIEEGTQELGAGPAEGEILR